jgi:hypothetical protein
MTCTFMVTTPNACDALQVLVASPVVVVLASKLLPTPSQDALAPSLKLCQCFSALNFNRAVSVLLPQHSV